MTRAVRFERYGGTEVLRVVEVERPEPGPGEVRVEVLAASINPGEAAIRRGLYDAVFPATFPSGQGSDFAGRVTARGAGVQGIGVGEEVIGFSDSRSAQATDVVVPATNVVPKPATVTWEEAATLYVAGTTAFAAVRAVGADLGDVVVVAGAAGGVGVFAAQLARHAGATVVGTARDEDHDFLRGLEIMPVTYGDGVVERIRALVPEGVDAFIDTHGSGNVAAAIELGVSPARIDTIADFAAVKRYGVKGEGNAAGGGARTLSELAALIVEGDLRIPIDTIYPFERVAEAYDHLDTQHVRGKIVLRME
ncbi:NADP-dependent oxidoreductase [Herbiconiux sp. CPCC 205763]|uniref:NADP-dependent oxidoreductase n=1 Tax=Herbiconiux aconitum TaxID=2970913 RepID=A0ABT2GQP6_9MICO|nr:NADP-dependent oxidoreductase [Herbiconiux aconitum]MCS5718543.1 NADP-dependent oxidoreductase [Herbiconiux aconitum]